jgi:hypothetical protein
MQEEDTDRQTEEYHVCVKRENEKNEKEPSG